MGAREKDLAPDDAVRAHGDDEGQCVEPGVGGEDEAGGVQEPGDRVEEVEVDSQQENGNRSELRDEAVEGGEQEPIDGDPLALHSLLLVIHSGGCGLGDEKMKILREENEFARLFTSEIALHNRDATINVR